MYRDVYLLYNIEIYLPKKISQEID